MLLKHTAQRFMVASVLSWRAWGFHANICLKKLPEGENISGKQSVKDRWTLSYYRTPSCIRFSKDPVPAKNDLESRLVNVIESENFKIVLSQAPEIVSLARGGGMKTFTEQYAVLKYSKVLEARQKQKCFTFWWWFGWKRF